MNARALKHIAIVVTVSGTIAGVALWALLAGPAEAKGQFTPSLKSSERAAKVAPTEVAGFDPKVTVKKTTVVRAAKTAARRTATRTTVSTRRTSGSEISRARSILASQIRRHPILRGTTVEFGNARGYQAISYYQSGRIVISRSHSASLERILSHEVWHIIDWRDNGRIDWGENVPR